MIEDRETLRLSENMNKVQILVLTGLLFSIALVLSLVENMLPPLPIAVPGIKFGLSNIMVMYSLFFIGAKQAYMIAILKSLFVFITRGFIASSLSLSGGLLSISVMLLLLFLLKEKVSYLGISIAGAVFHNIGQFLVVTLIYVGVSIWAYLPVLLISGVIAGILTAALLKVLLPVLKRLV
jgi:heptaprenyl diphosphate synthase